MTIDTLWPGFSAGTPQESKHVVEFDDAIPKGHCVAAVVARDAYGPLFFTVRSSRIAIPERQFAPARVGREERRLRDVAVPVS